MKCTHKIVHNITKFLLIVFGLALVGVVVYFLKLKSNGERVFFENVKEEKSEEPPVKPEAS